MESNNPQLTPEEMEHLKSFEGRLTVAIVVVVCIVALGVLLYLTR